MEFVSVADARFINLDEEDLSKFRCFQTFAVG